MAGSVNKVILVGNLGRDPEVRYAQDGSKIVTFSLATSETWRDKATGERKDRTEWHRVVVFNDKLAEVIERYVSKGSKVYLEGQLQTRKWTDNTGQEKYTTEVVLPKFRGELSMLDAKGSSGGGSYDALNQDPGPGSMDQSTPDNGYGNGQNSNQGPGKYGNLDDDIPF